MSLDIPAARRSLDAKRRVHRRNVSVSHHIHDLKISVDGSNNNISAAKVCNNIKDYSDYPESAVIRSRTLESLLSFQQDLSSLARADNAVLNVMTRYPSDLIEVPTGSDNVFLDSNFPSVFNDHNEPGLNEPVDTHKLVQCDMFFDNSHEADPGSPDSSATYVDDDALPWNADKLGSPAVLSIPDVDEGEKFILENNKHFINGVEIVRAPFDYRIKNKAKAEFAETELEVKAALAILLFDLKMVIKLLFSKIYLPLWFLPTGTVVVLCTLMLKYGQPF
ncbi:hypothetical protein DASB73_027300 [Starmerella bacillaris]|uniref:Uncharacterized protein n=1 Tax=Starmerella bacillaris TaxID=1247836 RepID=A0AAV5RKL4_STABA|nr:hypothetical protein DASB73_027300 [Starmerella bacillaris]